MVASLPKPIETKNRFQVLTESEEEDEQIMEERLKARKERRERAENNKKSVAENPTGKAVTTFVTGKKHYLKLIYQ